MTPVLTQTRSFTSGLIPENILKKINQRTLPGVVIFGKGCQPLYLNLEASNIISRLSPGKSGIGEDSFSVPEELINLCKELPELASRDPSSVFPLSYQDQIVIPPDLYVCRAFPLYYQAPKREPDSFLVLLERFSLRGMIEWNGARQAWNLSQSEIKVIGLLAEGKSNKEIAEGLFVSVHTVKDHLKNIMAKMGVNNRTKILAELLKHSR